MNKIIVVILLIIRVIISPFCNLVGRGTKTVELKEKAQVGLTGIYMTVLDYKRVYPSIEQKDLEPKKYFAFKVTLDGTNTKDQNFGKFVGEVNCNGETYYSHYMTGLFYVEGKIGSKSKVIGAMTEQASLCSFVKDFPIVSVDKSKENVDMLSGWVVFELPEDFEISKFYFRYYEKSDISQILFPEAKVQIVFSNPIK
jgi:hypothetical protein